jgi:hypothetical protein
MAQIDTILKRIGFLALASAALGACASTPAPIELGGRGTAAPVQRAQAMPRPPSFDSSAAPRIVEGRARLQCVPYAREASGVAIWGDAYTWWDQAAGRYPRSSRPAPGSVLVLRGYRTDTRGHVAVVTGIESSRVIRVDQANWLNQEEVSVNVPVLDVSPNNDWSEVRVWHIPSGQWGARVYQSRGFIHAFRLVAGS